MAEDVAGRAREDCICDGAAEAAAGIVRVLWTMCHDWSCFMLDVLSQTMYHVELECANASKAGRRGFCWGLLLSHI